MLVGTPAGDAIVGLKSGIIVGAAVICLNDRLGWLDG